MNERIRNEETAEKRLSAAVLTKLFQVGLCSNCRERLHLQLDYRDLADFLKPFVLFELMKAYVDQAEETVNMTEAQRRSDLVKLRNDLKTVSQIADQASRFYE